MVMAGCLRRNRKCPNDRAGTWQVIVKSPGDIPLGVNTISQPTVLQSGDPWGMVLDPGIPADQPVFILTGRADGASHDRSHNDNPGHEERGEALCIVQSATDPYEPERQVEIEFAMHVMKIRSIFFIKYS
jgi:hypothetical protein